MEFDVIDYVKREWKIALVIIILFNIISAFIMFKVQKVEYQSKISIKLPQYIFTNPDVQTIIYLGENFIADEAATKKYGVRLKGATNPGTTIIDFTITGPDEEKVLVFTQEVKPKLLGEIDKLMQERFTYEWQLRNAQSGNITDYNTISEKVHLASATDLTYSQPMIQKIQQRNTKKMLTILFGSIILSGSISILHYLFTIKNNKHNDLK
ncbi:hypothetical protein [Acidaminococcus massiliensis]|uniref:hypothetical protein n=1 Tax=Acidaminococcus massiliensis TaxID=1852375 RepID=UPI0026DD3BDC|nr:hypothetical protein [Acidaminococcus massiliensis]